MMFGHAGIALRLAFAGNYGVAPTLGHPEYLLRQHILISIMDQATEKAGTALLPLNIAIHDTMHYFNVPIEFNTFTVGRLSGMLEFIPEFEITEEEVIDEEEAF
eukprot:NODE_8301_length_710_cov_117.393526_g8047_i0.p1 GENE.NODE_8301_length_710_cov_117.393526_g8047_i0~~NODE_8301_length_710_cov_117.393526_g8047_i0.p1  ORF type:complete len:104 (+),score=27.24 NODE_8301_length_710_cov_117.393526_g8047_i0:200-511(+)